MDMIVALCKRSRDLFMEIVQIQAWDSGMTETGDE